MSIEDDIRRREREIHELAVLKARDPKLEKRRMRNELKIAKASSSQYQEQRTLRALMLAGAVVVATVASCAAYTETGPNNESLIKYQTCIENGGTWDGNDESCEK